MSLAIFDLDNTLLGGDSDYLWGRFLAENGIVDGLRYERENQRFYEEYKAGTLDILEFLRFSLRPLADNPLTALLELRQRFIRQAIAPIVLPKAKALVRSHRDAGRTLLIITATNSFVAAPIAELYDIDVVLATEPEFCAGVYTGGVIGIPCFREGKVRRLEQWLAETGRNLSGSWFYSDSHNDLPLLERVEYPVAVDPDPTLAAHAAAKGWEILTLR